MASASNDSLRELLDNGDLEPYITHVRFPDFKNLSKMLEINFSFPISAIVGANGTSKTTILRAIEGCPGRNNLGQHWFSTKLDEITVRRHQYVHGYKSPGYGKVVEVIKSRIVAKGAESAGERIDPDYFETSRPLESAGMQPMPTEEEYSSSNPDRVATRWRPISKSALYLDYRTKLSAFDKFYYHGPSAGETSSQQKKDRIRRWAARLALAFDNSRRTDFYFGKQRIIEGPISANGYQLRWISQILGRKYEEVIYLRHNYFHPPGADSEGWTVRMKTANLQYSEAFAGSGEFSVAMTVRDLSEAPERSLIILDEPEVSLHPRSQAGLVAFFRDQVKRRGHQIIFATHSAEMIRTLPPDAIKVIALNDATDEAFLLSNATSAADAFVRLGLPMDKGVRVLVEDKLAQAVVNRALRSLTAEARDRISIEVFGGSEALLTVVVPLLAKTGDADTLMVLDGDARRTDLQQSRLLPIAEHEERVTEIVGKGLKLLISGGGSDEAHDTEKASAYASILDWTSKYLTFLPTDRNPEWYLAEYDDPSNVRLTDNVGDDNRQAKQFWVNRAAEKFDLPPGSKEVTAARILMVEEETLARIPTDDPGLAEIRKRVEGLLREHDQGGASL